MSLARRGELALARALAVEAATRERERLSRDIHDGVLQVLALVGRRGREAGGEAAEIGRLAAEQEQALRALVGARAARTRRRATVDLRALLTAYASPSVTVSTPATPVGPGRGAGPRGGGGGRARRWPTSPRTPATAARAWVLLEARRGTSWW